MLLAVAPVTGTPWLLAIAIDSGEALHAISTVLQASPGAGVVLLLVALVLLVGTPSQRLRRLNQVRDAMNEIGAGDGGLSRRIDARGEDELALIAASFNGFACKLSGTSAQLRDASRRWPKSTR